MERREFLGTASGVGAVVVGTGSLMYLSLRDREPADPPQTDYADGSDDDPSDETDGEGQEGDDGSTAEEEDEPEEQEEEEGGEEEEEDPDARDGWLLSGVTGRSIEPMEQWLGTRHAVNGTFVNVGASGGSVESVPSSFEAAWQRGQVPHVWWQPFIPDRERTSNEINREIAEGDHDALFESWRDAIAEWAIREDEPDRRLYLNLAPEMNGDWSPWSPALGDDDEDDFVAMWRRVHDIVMDSGLEPEHVQWIWTLDNTTRNVDREAVYPGDEYVDWAGIHGYNWAQWGGWESAEEVYGYTVRSVREITDRPIAVTEFGSSSETVDGDHDPDRKAEWITDAYEYLREEDVRMAVWFNIVKETDWAAFDAEHGVETATVGGEEYEVYPAYREAIRDEGVLGRHPEHPRVLTDAEFAGEF